jgi:hypothetical protein
LYAYLPQLSRHLGALNYLVENEPILISISLDTKIPE